MINKDYILRLAESFGRALAIILGLREYNQQEEALIYIDDLLLKTVGLTSRFINSLSEEMLVQAFSPMAVLNTQACLWTAVLLKAEGEIYEDLGNTTESYYRYLKSLHLFLTALLHEPAIADTNLSADIATLIGRLAEYELPLHTKRLLFAYYEHLGQYAKAEDTLFDFLESHPQDATLLEQGRAFYQRLQLKSDADLLAGNLSRGEVEEGIEQLEEMAGNT